MKIELDGEDNTITVDGVRMSLELLRLLANPDAKRFYSLVRKGDVVTVQAFELTSPIFEQRSAAN